MNAWGGTAKEGLNVLTSLRSSCELLISRTHDVGELLAADEFPAAFVAGFDADAFVGNPAERGLAERAVHGRSLDTGLTPVVIRGTVGKVGEPRPGSSSEGRMAVAGRRCESPRQVLGLEPRCECLGA